MLLPSVRSMNELYNMKPVTILCNTRFPSSAAHATYLARLSESFSAEGADVELVIPKRFRELSGDPMKIFSVKNQFRIRKIFSFDFMIFGSVLGRAAFWLQYLNFYVFIFVFFLFRSRRRIVYTMDNLGCLLSYLGFPVIFESHVGIGQYRRRLLPLLKRAKAIVVVNEIIKKEFVAAGFAANKILVARNGVDIALFDKKNSKMEIRNELGLPADRKIVGYVGKYKTMGMEKGVSEFVTAVGGVLKSKTGVFLLIVGLTEDEKTELAATCASAGLSQNDYLLVGHVSQLSVAKYMMAADALVMNYPDNPHYAFYMSPMKMFEYMASDNPIIASDLPSIREVLNNKNSLLVRPGDAADLSAKISWLFDHPAEAKMLAERARAEVLENSWQNRGKNILEFVGANAR